MASDWCPVCSGSGKLIHALCGGLGYRREFGERVTCECSGGKIPCLPCNGTGRRRRNIVSTSAAADAGGAASPEMPLSLAGLQSRYDEAVRDARKCRDDLLAQLERDQLDLDGGKRLAWDAYWGLRQWLRDIDVEAPDIEKELSAAVTELEKAGRRELTDAVERLVFPCSRIGYYRSVIALRQGRPEEK
jgi:hypothetical protein